jgi:hypothetical protein
MHNLIGNQLGRSICLVFVTLIIRKLLVHQKFLANHCGEVRILESNLSCERGPRSCSVVKRCSAMQQHVAAIAAKRYNICNTLYILFQKFNRDQRYKRGLEADVHSHARLGFTSVFLSIGDQPARKYVRSSARCPYTVCGNQHSCWSMNLMLAYVHDRIWPLGDNLS